MILHSFQIEIEFVQVASRPDSLLWECLVCRPRIGGLRWNRKGRGLELATQQSYQLHSYHHSEVWTQGSKLLQRPPPVNSLYKLRSLAGSGRPNRARTLHSPRRKTRERLHLSSPSPHGNPRSWSCNRGETDWKGCPGGRTRVWGEILACRSWRGYSMSRTFANLQLCQWNRTLEHRPISSWREVSQRQFGSNPCPDTFVPPPTPQSNPLQLPTPSSI